MNLISKQDSKLKAEDCQLGCPRPQGEEESPMVPSFTKFSILQWAGNPDAALRAPPREKAAYLEMRYAL